MTLTPDNAIEELNHRLRSGGVGYQFTGGQIIRVDSQFIHSEVVVEALRLLQEPGFEGPEDEFEAAHKHYRAGEHRDAIADAGNAFEITMKAICKKLGWPYAPRDRASDLLKLLRDRRLFRDYLDNSFDQLLAFLKSGLPAVRNNEGSHGQGAAPRVVPDHIAAYAMHLAASNIVFLVESMKYFTEVEN